MLITYLISLCTFLHGLTIINTYMSRCVCVCVCVNAYVEGVFLSLLVLQHLCMFAQSCPILSDPTDCSPPGSSLHGICRQEYWSVSCPRVSSRPRDQTHVSWVSSNGRRILYRPRHLFCRGGVISYAHFCLFLSLTFQCFLNAPVWWAFGKGSSASVGPKRGKWQRVCSVFGA